MTVLYESNGGLNPRKNTSSLLNPIAKITKTSMNVNTISSVDITNSIFTTTNPHNMSNGNRIFFTLNDTQTTNVYLPNVITGGVSGGTRYYVVNATANTFQVSTTSGGTAVTLSTNASQDLTKWHVESDNVSSGDSLQINNLPSKSKYRFILKGKFGASDTFYLDPSGWTTSGGWVGTNNSWNVVSVNIGSIYSFQDCFYDGSNIGYYYIKYAGFYVSHNTSSAMSWSNTNNGYVSLTNGSNTITSVNLHCNNMCFLNGTTLEVYDV